VVERLKYGASHKLERLILRLYVVQVRHRLIKPHGHKPFRVRVGQRSQQDCVDDAEDRRVGADSEGQCDDCDQGEPGTLYEQPDPKAKVLEEFVHFSSFTSFVSLMSLEAKGHKGHKGPKRAKLF